MRFQCYDCRHYFLETVANLKRNPELTCPRGHVNLVTYSSDREGLRGYRVQG